MSDELNSRGYMRCTACDRRFYPRWRPEIEEFEELCWKCLPVAMKSARTDMDTHKTSLDRWGEEASPDELFVEGYVMDKPQDYGDLHSEDPYLEYGEGAMGDLGLLDSYGDN
jgi:hypothetical protein